MSISTELQQVSETKEALKQALIESGVTLPQNASFLDYVIALNNKFNDIATQLQALIAGF